MLEGLKDVIKVIEKKRLDLFYKVALYQFFRFSDHEGFKVVEEEWENLIVLDSCRYDAFERVNFIEGDLSRKESRGTTTVQWLNQNFTGNYEDIAYLSTVNFVHPQKESDANFQHKPFNASDHFQEIENICKEEGIEKGVHLRPEITAEKARRFSEKHREKRVIIHFSQPHLPFITSEYVDEHDFDTYEQYLREGYTWEELKKEYRESLRKTLESVENLVEGLEGKTVITADHGDGHNEHYVKDHPHSIYIKPLVNVPWLEVRETEK